MPIRRALLSVSDKTGLVEFARALCRARRRLAVDRRHLRGAQGRRRAGRNRRELHRLARGDGGPREDPAPARPRGAARSAGIDDADLERIGARPIDLVVVNLYPFEQTLNKPGASFEELIENIDIGGPSMLRSAAKNHARVTVVCDPADYARVLEAIERQGDVPGELRERLAAKVFAHTAAYDAAIGGWLSARGEADGWPRAQSLPARKGLWPALRRKPAPARRVLSRARRDPRDRWRRPRASAAAPRSSASTIWSTPTPRSKRCASSSPGSGRDQAHEPVRRGDREPRWRRRISPRAKPTR